MGTYLFPIETALITFPIIAAALTIPYILIQYMRYGSVSALRSLIMFSFIFYLQTAFYLTVLPLPSPEAVLNSTGPFMQLIPFHFVYDFIQNTALNLFAPSTYLHALTQGVFIQPLFNIVLTIPFGIYLAYYFKKSMAATAFFTLLLSLFFELTQLSGLFGFYAHPYRLFDVDDLILNTLGGVIGFLIFRVFANILPSRDEIDRKNVLKSEKVGYARRFFALIIDCAIIVAASALFANNIVLIQFDLYGKTVQLVFALLYFILLPLIFGGRTAGKALVRVKLAGVSGSPFGIRLFFRELLLLTVLPFIGIISFLPGFFMRNDINYGTIAVAASFAFILADMLVGLAKHRTLFYERICKVINVNTKMPKVDAAVSPVGANKD